ncbi:MAG: hypothetical protein DMG41_16395 [Acidobacteria bacterium]|nr:MAG: hypothetical protein AUH13_26075 [Acidobacteria bacterium 13_2_20CM_58_27]PYT87180.1 MAG: hypothetical protein DMG41_16395 [Acidobacteriota bacterium]
MHLDDRAGKAPPDKGGGPTASIGGGSGFPFPGLFFFDNVPFLDLPDQFPLPVLIPPVGAKMSLSTEPVTKLTHPLSLRDLLKLSKNGQNPWVQLSTSNG